VVDSHGPGPRGAADAYRAARGRKPYRKISYALVAPERRGELAAIADEALRRAARRPSAELGARDARRWLARHPNVWCSDAAHDFDIDATAVASLREREALDEWRDLRRRP
jgi:NTE family protein